LRKIAGDRARPTGRAHTVDLRAASKPMLQCGCSATGEKDLDIGATVLYMECILWIFIIAILSETHCL